MFEFRTDLSNARSLKYHKKFDEALELYEKQYKRHPDKFSPTQKQDFAWLIFNVHIKDYEDEEDLFRYAEFITELVPQRNLRNKDLACVYTSAVFEVIKYCGSRKDYQSMIPWFDKIKMEFLNPFTYTRNGKKNKSKKEVFADFASNAYFKTGYYEECIDVCKMAIDTVDDLVDDYWLYWRCGKALKELNSFSDAIIYLKHAVKTDSSRYVYSDISECYYMMGKPLEALKYACPVIFDEASSNEKMEIYYLIYKILRDFNPEQALNHAKFYYLLKKESNHVLPYDIRQLNLDESQLDKDQLESEIMEIWNVYRIGQEKSRGE